jgi:hypothetical protein
VSASTAIITRVNIVVARHEQRAKQPEKPGANEQDGVAENRAGKFTRQRMVIDAAQIELTLREAHRPAAWATRVEAAREAEERVTARSAEQWARKLSDEHHVKAAKQRSSAVHAVHTSRARTHMYLSSCDMR